MITDYCCRCFVNTFLFFREYPACCLAFAIPYLSWLIHKSIGGSGGHGKFKESMLRWMARLLRKDELSISPRCFITSSHIRLPKLPSENKGVHMYSPKIREEYIPVLYKIAKERRKPMTVIVNEMIAESLAKQQESDNVTEPEDSKGENNKSGY